MNEVYVALGIIVISLFFGLLAASPVLVWVWWKANKEKKEWEKELKENDEVKKYKEVRMVRIADSELIQRLLKWTNFSGKGLLLINENEIKYKQAGKEEVKFDPMKMKMEWVGYLTGTGWVPWFKLTSEDNKSYYFSGSKINLQATEEIYQKIAEITGRSDVEIEVRNYNRFVKRSSLGWVRAIAGLTLLNSILTALNINLVFLVGLSTVQLMDNYFIVSGNNLVAGLFVSMVISGGFFYLAKKMENGNNPTSIIALVLLIIDTLIMLVSAGSDSKVGTLMFNALFKAIIIGSVISGIMAPDKDIN